MIGHVAKAGPEDLSSPYDVEYRASEEDAWYIVHVALDANAEKLTAKYRCSPEEYAVAFAAAEFATEAQVAELVARFRPVSKQLENRHCGMLEIGTTVCAAADGFKFYDAVVEAVKREAHSFVDGKEVCLCKFVLVWQHGPGRATLTYANISTICSIAQPATVLHPTISAFAIMANNKITSSHSISSTTKILICLSDSDSETSQNASLVISSINGN